MIQQMVRASQTVYMRTWNIPSRRKVNLPWKSHATHTLPSSSRICISNYRQSTQPLPSWRYFLLLWILAMQSNLLNLYLVTMGVCIYGINLDITLIIPSVYAILVISFFRVWADLSTKIPKLISFINFGKQVLLSQNEWWIYNLYEARWYSYVCQCCCPWLHMDRVHVDHHFLEH